MKLLTLAATATLTILFTFINPSIQDCAFVVGDDGEPRLPVGNEAIPSKHTYSQPFICEKQYPGANCCNDY